jgi:hydroxymethylglutaryl-CoA synthase
MSGIVSYGAYIPRYRIDRKRIYKAMGWLNPATFMPGEKAVANYDEDSLTMAVAAGIDCLTGIDREKVDAVFFATTTSPYAERQNAEIMATAFDCRTDIRTADFTDTPKAGTTAVLSALDAVVAGSAKNVLVCAGDMRVGRAGSAQEQIFGDGAAALLMGEEDVAAEFIGSFSVSHDFVDHWRGAGKQFDQQWEDRFIRDEGYTRFIVEAMKGLEKECGVKSSELSSIVYPCLYARDFKKISRVLELSESQLVAPLLGQVGYAGTSDPLLHLVKALEEAKPGDRIAVVGFGAGADALLFEVTGEIEKNQGKRRGVHKHLARREELKSYEKMVAFRDLLHCEKGIRGDTVAFTALSALWRNRKEILGLYGSRCEVCGTPQYPVQRICVKPDCGAVDEMVPYRFSDRKGTLFTYTGDNLAFSINPPAIYGIVDFEGGGRYWFDLTDVDLEEVKVDMPVEMSFRKKYVDEKWGIHGYFWKAIPVMI